MSSPLVIGSVSTSQGAPTSIGNLDSPLVANVDSRGRVTPWPNGWSLDWWIGAEDRWHLPAREVAVRQGLIDASPVVETAMRIPGGDAVHRAYAIRRSSLDNGGELVIVDVENRSKVPVAMAFAVQPENPDGSAAILHLDLHDEIIVTVDGHVALLLPKPPARSCTSTSGSADVVDVVSSGEAEEGWSGPVQSTDGSARAAFVYALTHGTSLQLALPLEPFPYPMQPSPRPRSLARLVRPARLGRAGRSARPVRPALFARSARPEQRGRGTEPGQRQEEPAPTFPQAIPGAADVARGWATQTGRGMRLDLADGRLTEGVEAARCSLLLLHDSDRLTRPTPGQANQRPFGSQDAASLLHAMDLYGFHEEVARAIALSADTQRDDGLFSPRKKNTPHADGALLWTLGHHWRLTRDPELVGAMVDAIAASATRIGLERGRQRSRRPGLRGRADQNGGVGNLEDQLWRVAGLQAAAELLAAADEPKAAEDAARVAADAVEALAADKDTSTDAGPGGAALLDPALGASRADLAASGETVQSGNQGAEAGDSDHVVNMQLAGAELLSSDPRCLQRLAAVLDAASSTWTWSNGVQSQPKNRTMSPEYQALVAAGLLKFVRHLLVRETWEPEKEPRAGQGAPQPDVERSNGLALATLVPEAWLGQGWEVHDAPTAHGRLSYAVRWHGERPAILWELQPHAQEDTDRKADSPAASPRLTAPGLDPSWSAADAAGEALLSPFTSQTIQ